MSLNLLSYTAANHLEWERYADIVNQWANGHGLYPGTPPAGYQECFKIKQKYTPVPKDYPDLLHASSRVKDVPSTASAKVSMSATAFGTILQSQQVFMENVMDNNRRNNVTDRIDHCPIFRGRRFGGRGGHGRFGGRGGQRGHIVNGHGQLLDRLGGGARDRRAGGPRAHNKNRCASRPSDGAGSVTRDETLFGDGGVNTAADDGVDEPDTAADVDEPFGPDDIPEEGELDDVEDTGMDMAGIQT
ncbi:hypothetical protein GGX14DRAFT_485499 [Mycena pura]|uniref:Uncharacterized protein n=1 Tax=Mycena pura TaxID=153505 RepID=A0AAD6XYT1_9AGAR|nr:hypothetical protein GGX14DRAFT_485499 [Mycena pura]